ncbi:MAG: bis(5'-nucleosyl)-tetraphosphatase (symmetrical) YqeK [Bacilli bacterium]|jgi:predicted HD superfamily hydrolase involved in NAD metabolism|nr:bis(5'-nucleosyl)-tetraphosphatase (symmetrical) YqeK [Bacilli bacterium]
MAEKVLLFVSSFDPYLLTDHLILLNGVKNKAFTRVNFLVKKDKTPFKEKEKLIKAAVDGLSGLTYSIEEYEELEKGIEKKRLEGSGDFYYLYAPILSIEEKKKLTASYKGLKEYSCGLEDSLSQEEYLKRQEEIRLGRSFLLPLASIKVLLEEKMYFVPQVLPYYKERRYQHCLRVGEVAFNIALKNHLDPYKAYLASYYHDITRAGAKLSYEKRAKEEEGQYFKNCEVPSWVLHQFTAPMLLKEEFHLEDEEVLEAIKYHTTGKKEMSWLGQVLYASDKIEPGRGYASSGLIEKMEENYQTGFKAVLEANAEYLFERLGKDGMDDKLTESCLAYYLKGDSRWTTIA